MVALVENLFQHVECLKRPCGFSIRVRNGTCCHKVFRTIRRYVDASRLGVVMRFCGGC